MRLTILGLRDSALPAAYSSPLSFGLLRNGCPIAPTAAAINGSAIIAFDTPLVWANGYYLDIAADGTGTQGHDPVQWVVEALSINSTGWKIIGASQQLSLGSFASFFPGLAYPTPLSARNGSMDGAVRVAVDGRPDWVWIIQNIGVYAASFVGWISLAISGLVGRQGLAIWILICLFGCNCAQCFASALAQNVAGSAWRETVEIWLLCCMDLATAGMLYWDESRAIVALFVYGVLNLGIQVGLLSQFYTMSSWNVDTPAFTDRQLLEQCCTLT